MIQPFLVVLKQKWRDNQGIIQA